MTGGEVRDGHGRGPPGGAGVLRVLVSFTPEYAIYGDVLRRELRASRPDLRVELAPFPEAAGAAARLRPHLVVSDGTVTAPGMAKAGISAEPTEPSTMRSEGVVRRQFLPAARLQEGFKGMYVMLDAAAGRSLAVTLWETEEDMVRSEEAMRRARAESAATSGETVVSVERYEVAFGELAGT